MQSLPYYILNFLAGIAVMACLVVAKQGVDEAAETSRCARQFNVYSCDRVVVYMPRKAG